MTAPATTSEPRPRGAERAAPVAPDDLAARPSGSARRAWRRSRLPAALIGGLLLAGVLIAMLSPHPQVNGYLDPASTAPYGSQALSDILGERGFDVVSTYAPADALAKLRAAAGGPAATTLLITSPGLLKAGQLRSLAREAVHLVVVAPGRAALAALPASLRPGTIGVQSRQPDGLLLRPGCGLRAAALAGSANVGGYSYLPPAAAAGCYPVGGFPTLVSYAAGGRTVTILGNGAALTNGMLARNGNAALVLNLLGARHTIVWLTPEPSAPVGVAAPSGGQHRAAPSLLPAGVWLLIAQLGVVVALTAIWRARRFGPLITERLPVVVRASETVEGHARLYQSRRARARAATALREAMLGRVRPALGLARDASRDAVADGLAARSHLDGEQIAAIIGGPPPASDAELVRLARNLDELEREVRAQ